MKHRRASFQKKKKKDVVKQPFITFKKAGPETLPSTQFFLRRVTLHSAFSIDSYSGQVHTLPRKKEEGKKKKKIVPGKIIAGLTIIALVIISRKTHRKTKQQQQQQQQQKVSEAALCQAQPPLHVLDNPRQLPPHVCLPRARCCRHTTRPHHTRHGPTQRHRSTLHRRRYSE